jgi:hypothetical protein
MRKPKRSLIGKLLRRKEEAGPRRARGDRG